MAFKLDFKKNKNEVIPQDEMVYSTSVVNGALKGKIEVYNNFIKLTYNDYYNILYYNQIIRAEKYKNKGNVYFYIELRTDIGMNYQEHWQLSNFLKSGKLTKIITFINEKAQQCQLNNDINTIKAIAEPGSDNRLFLIGSITDSKSSLMGRTKQAYTSITYLEEDYVLVQKLSAFRKKERGDKKVPYDNISSIDYDKAGTFGVTNCIEITVSGSDIISLKSISTQSTENFYNILTKIVQNRKKGNSQPQIIQQEAVSNADELMKWHDLYQAGVISEEEFNQKKNELL